MFRFEDPWVLGLLAIVPLTYWLGARGERRTGALRFSALDMARQAGNGISVWLPRVPALLGAVGVTAVIVALARPQTGITSETLLTEGIDIIMVMDVSSSMLAEDLEPNRLQAAKGVAADFVGGRRNDRIGLVAFAGEAFTQAPLTLDYSVVQSLIGELQVGIIEDGTAVGMGLGTAVKRLQASDAESKVVILLTDGRSNRGEIGPVTAARMAQALGVRVYTVGVGTRGNAPVPIADPLVGTRLVPMRVDIDEPTLQEIAELTGGRYFRATDNESLTSIYEEIDQLERTEIEVENFTQYAERFPVVLAFGLLLLLMEVGLAQTVLRKLP
ncbi:MAG: VWA domain-containing protein [Gemmatimonadetes bacterium]|jgi:Ca-activated chloride channel family protein|nr:VWA domain-containing protein [Gemmatimonadota bacterium]|tara:strand:+ start:4077 stop:5063 length:987 start_codon:yes stop_codon:yes gene_type:complete